MGLLLAADDLELGLGPERTLRKQVSKVVQEGKVAAPRTEVGDRMKIVHGYEGLDLQAGLPGQRRCEESPGVIALGALGRREEQEPERTVGSARASGRPTGRGQQHEANGERTDNWVEPGHHTFSIRSIWVVPLITPSL